MNSKPSIVLGLDVGINSVGFALVDLEESKIVQAGVHCFDKAENPKNGESLALPRREARGARRRLRRRSKRLARLLKIFVSEGWVSNDGTKGLGRFQDPWTLRAEILDRRASSLEFARAIYHIAKHRGFRSNKKDQSAEASSDDNKKALAGTAAMVKQLEDSGYRTIGEYLFKSGLRKRNAEGSYERTVLRSLHENEFRLLCQVQRSFGFGIAKEIEDSMFDLVFGQLPILLRCDITGASWTDATDTS